MFSATTHLEVQPHSLAWMPDHHRLYLVRNNPFIRHICTNQLDYQAPPAYTISWMAKLRLPQDFPWEGTAIASNFNRKCEALVVSGLVDYGDEIDVIAPADVLKQIFKMPYSKARLSIAALVILLF
ncbi:hypothetical protein VNO80_14505 [Phaseolus coccineus]|uniref:Uncharacterized protein n=1 Tax=Phaseolus coccineus TaxID=3886 RepID=A0AAN9MLX9_PHACN